MIVNVATTDNRPHAAGREGANLVGGLAGGAAGGAITGASFGMALGPIGVAAGMVIDGALGPILADEVYLEAAGVVNREVDAIIDPCTSIMRVDSSGLAAAILRERGINMDRALTVFAAPRRDYSMSLDDVAAHYVEGVRRAGGSVPHALRLRQLLADAMEGGWTTRREGELAACAPSAPSASSLKISAPTLFGRSPQTLVRVRGNVWRVRARRTSATILKSQDVSKCPGRRGRRAPCPLPSMSE